MIQWKNKNNVDKIYMNENYRKNDKYREFLLILLLKTTKENKDLLWLPEITKHDAKHDNENFSFGF